MFQELDDTLPDLREESQLSNQVQETLLQVMLSAKAVVDDAGKILHQQSTHYLVDKAYLDRLQEALQAYATANENYINAVDDAAGTPSTPEL